MAVKSLVLKSFLLLLLVSVVLLLLTRDALLQTKNTAHTSFNETSPWLIIFWSTIFGSKVDLHLAWKKGECPVACEVTSNHSRVKEADGFVVHARDSNMIPPVDSVPWILFTQENPVYTPVLTDAIFMSKFKLLRSYRLDSDFPDPTFYKPDLTPPIPFEEKTAMVFAAFSNCEPVRIEYMKQLMKFIPIDSYGNCLKNKQGLTARYGKDFEQHKAELSRKYKFTLVFFNQDCDYFVDKQLTHALSAGSVPVVMGTDKLDEFLPANLRRSIIRVRDFKSPRHLADYIKYLSSNKDEYSKYLEWKWKGFGDIEGTNIGKCWMPKYPLYCQICVALSEGRIHNDGLRVDICKKRAFKDWGINPS